MILKRKKVKCEWILKNANQYFKNLKNIKQKFTLNKLLNIKPSKTKKRYKEDNVNKINYFSNQNNVIKRNLKLFIKPNSKLKAKFNLNNKNNKSSNLRLFTINKTNLNNNFNKKNVKENYLIKKKINYLSLEKLKIETVIKNYFIIN